MGRQYKWDLVAEAKRWFADAQREYQFGVGMDALYAMCRKAPEHGDLKTTISKLWLIGRSHSAALERLADTRTYREPYEQAAAAMMARGKLDRLLGAVRRAQMKLYSRDHLFAIDEIVQYASDIFAKATGLNKPSLASKYLHFHVPSIPIYDSITRAGLRCLVHTEDVPHDARDLLDREYGTHLARFCGAYRRLIDAGIKGVDARAIDTFLLYWDEHAVSPIASART